MTEKMHDKKLSANGFILREIQQGAGVQKLMDKVFDKWYYPSLFLNISRNIEHYSKFSSEYDPWEPILTNGSLIHEPTEEAIESALSKRKDPDNIVSFEACDHRYIIAFVGSDENPLGFLLLHCPRLRSNDAAIEICKTLSKAIDYLKEDDAVSNISDRDYTRNYIASELLRFDDNSGNASPAAGQSENMNSPLLLSIRPQYRIAAISSDSKIRELFPAIENQIYQMYSKSYFMVKSNTLYMFFYDLSDEKSGSDERLRDCLKRVAKYYSVAVSLSSRFDAINQRNVYRRQSIDLLRLFGSIHNAPGLIEADDYYPEQMLFASVNRIGKEALMLREISYLRDYDEAEGTEYLDTLCAYLKCSGIIRAAAEELHIQPKSLRYRIKRISEILDRSSDSLLEDTSLLLSVIAGSLD